MRDWIDPFSLPEELHPRPDNGEKEIAKESKFQPNLGTRNWTQGESFKPVARKRRWWTIFWR